MSSFDKVNKLFRQIKSQGLLDDRREYDVGDLQSTYNLSNFEAKILFQKIQKASR